MPRHQELKIKRNRKIIARYDQLKKQGTYSIRHIFDVILRGEFYLESGTIEHIVYNRKEWLEEPVKS